MPFHQEMSIEFEKLESTECVDSAQSTTVTSHKDWLDIESVDASVQKTLSNLLSLGRTRKMSLEVKKELKAEDAFMKYYKQGEPRESDHQTDLIQICQI